MVCIVHGVPKSQTRLSDLHFQFHIKLQWKNYKQKNHMLGTYANISLYY